jgi:hypothetical protein
LWKNPQIEHFVTIKFNEINGPNSQATIFSQTRSFVCFSLTRNVTNGTTSPPGPLVIVTLAWPLLHLATRSDRGRLRAAVIEVGSAAVCGLGLFWFVTRAYG